MNLAVNDVAALRAQVQQQVAQHAGREGPLLEILHGLNAHYGYVPPAVVPLLADALNLSRAEVHGVLSFYVWFRATPPGRHTLRLCRGEACQAMGAAALEQGVAQSLGVAMHGTSSDGRVTLEPVYCLGNCACAPSAMLDGEVLGRLDLGALVSRLEALP